jgi:anti-sigma factor RsiW
VTAGDNGVAKLPGRGADAWTARGSALTCQELVELVTDYFEDALAPADRARFEAHVAGCPGCDAYLGQMRTTLEVVRATAVLQARPEVSALLEAFRAWRRGQA